MVASITDKFNKTGDGSGVYPTTATVSTSRSAGASTLVCDDLTGWTTDTAVHFTTYRLNSDGTVDTTTQTDWKGIVNGNSITNLTFQAGAADAGNLTGDKVEMSPNVGWANDLMDGLLTTCTQSGALKDGVVTSAKIGTDAVTSAKIKKIDLLNLVYPVGAIYMSVNATNPSTLLGGTWERIQDKFLLGASSTYSAGSTGGEAKHTLTTAELPVHKHSGVNWTTYPLSFDTGTSSTKGFKPTATWQESGIVNASSFTTGNTGSGTAHNNMPPYLSVYIWKRTA